MCLPNKARQVKNASGRRRPLAPSVPPPLLHACLPRLRQLQSPRLCCLLCSARQQHQPPLQSPPAKRAPFHSPKSLNKQSRKQPRSTTGLPQVRSQESGPGPRSNRQRKAVAQSGPVLGCSGFLFGASFSPPLWFWV